MNKQNALIYMKNKRTLRAYSMSVLFCSLHALHANTIHQSEIELYPAQRAICSPDATLLSTTWLNEHEALLALYPLISRGDIQLSAGGDIGIGQSPGSAKMSITPGTNQITLALATSGTAAGLVLSGGTPALSIVAGGATITAGDTTLNAGNIALTNSTSSTTGNITKGGSRFIHNYGTDNAFFGVTSGNFTLTGSENTAIGVNAGLNLSSGSSNTILGKDAAYNITTSGRNIFLGRGASYESTTSQNCIVIQCRNGGGGTSLTANDQIRIGFSDTASTSCFIDGIRGRTTGVADAVTVLVDSAGQLGTASSSRRYKENIQSLNDVSKPFMQLNPVAFNYKSDASHTCQYGLIAEEVEQLFPELVVYNKEGEVETVKYHLLYALLIKMIQENRTLALENRALIEQLQQAFALMQTHAA
jgi:hypothetical protein